jgi:hypothetical protein
VDGQLTELGAPQTFEVKSLQRRGLEGAPLEDVVAFTQRLDDLNRQVTGAGAALQQLLTEATAIKDTLLRSTAPQALRDRARALELELQGLQERLAGNEARDLMNEGGPVPIQRRLEVAVLGTFRSTYGPTATHRRSVDIATDEFAGVKAEIARVNDETLPALRRDLDAAGVPWTPGRAVPAVN